MRVLNMVDVAEVFSTDDPSVMRLTAEVFDQCILGKIFPAEPPMLHNWISPGGKYCGQWIWDTMFVVDLLCILPGYEQSIRDVFQNYWDFQERWNRVMPDYAHDMIACMFEPGNHDWIHYPAYSQIPILAWGVERVYQRTGDRELVRQSLAPLERFHEWYWRERDVTNVGLVAVGSYSGVTQHARYETFDNECNLDDLIMTRHPTRQGEAEGCWYGDICAAGNTSYLIQGERSLQRLAEVMGDRPMSLRRQARIDKAVEAMRTHMWDQEAGTFLSVKRDTLEKIPVATIGGWIPLAAGVPTADMARRMSEVLRTPGWQTPVPVPTVHSMDPRYVSSGFWRGDTWPATNYQICCGLAAFGDHELAAAIADKTVENAIRNGISERYDSISGRAEGVPHLGMTCTVLTLMLEGLCRKYRLEIRKV